MFRVRYAFVACCPAPGIGNLFIWELGA
jgi:hypothetical protein